jgi:RimJ/RimL family protein N-acetyltransferase
MSIILKKIDKTDYSDILELTTNIDVMKYIGNGKIWDSNKVNKFIKYNLDEENMKDNERQNYYYKIQEISDSHKNNTTNNITDKNNKNSNFVGIIGFHIMNNRDKLDKNIKYKQFYLTIYINPNKQGKGYYSKSVNLLIEIKTTIM